MKNWIDKFLLSLFLFYIVHFCSFGSIIKHTLYINQGTFITTNSTTFPALAFNDSKLYNRNSTCIRLVPNDQLILTVVNRDNIPHGFKIKNNTTSFGVIKPLESKTDTIAFTTEGVYIYYDDSNFPSNSYLGLSGFISVFKATNAKSFYWNLKEHQIEFNRSLIQNKPVTWNTYDPDFFTINGNSFPQLMEDTLARIIGSVGDTINIFVGNTGQSAHALHFHGFHCKILYSSKSAVHKGWIKDSFPIKSMEGMILQMVPDKLGEYSVHDHNLMAMSGELLHPFGMVMIMLIE